MEQVTLSAPTPTVTYSYQWTGIDGPRGTSVESRFTGRPDGVVYAVTEITVTEFPGTDEPHNVTVKGVALNRDGSRDRRHSYSKTVCLDERLIAEMHATAKASL